VSLNASTNIAAAGAVVSPWWLPVLKTASEGAAMLLPIVGLLWLGIQIAGYFLKRK